ncbi:hypothetical protein AJ79_02145 [Helicocarpus griseus UAMH5409]|uniref:Amino acid transporter transmembrane domain-containing protein n=1 Tax=Helicocarpus griseus UAMH5409 TaxID=1447875 RepID=A0A2B7Y3I2_9EURO|nr:hypothetical protein AJ79_02145 [Helicocarpus griseus UAMH5409]
MAVTLNGEEVQEKQQQHNAANKVGETDKADLESAHSLPPYDKHEENKTSDPFGNEETADVKYKVLTWWQCGLLMIAETMSLGILALPSAVATLGLVPAIIILLFVGLLATYTGYTIGQFKAAYPHVHSMADAGEILLGKFGRELLGAGQLLFLIFIMASHVLTFTVMMNVLSEHGTCTIVFGVVGMIVSLILTLPRTLKKVSWLSIASFISIFSAVMITMVAAGVQHPGKGKPLQATTDTDLYHAFLAVCNIIFAYCGHVAFFGFASELTDLRDYPKALYTLQGTNTTFYTITAVVIYRYVGPDVASPALSSTGPLLSKIAYGIACPTIVIAGVINGHVACKYIYVRMFRGTDRMSQRSWLSIGTWVGLATALWVIAWIIAEAIPVFNNLLSLITALFASWFTFGVNGMFWLFLNKGRYTESKRKIALTALNIFCVLVGAVVCGLGLYVSGRAIHEDSGSNGSFSCANNADA